MTRMTLILLLGLSMLISFSVQANNRGGHHNNHYKAQQHKFKRHYNKHASRYDRHGRHHNKHFQHHYYSNYDSHYHNNHRYRYGSHSGFSSLPHLAPGTRYGYARNGTVIIYQPRYPGDYHY